MARDEGPRGARRKEAARAQAAGAAEPPGSSERRSAWLVRRLAALAYDLLLLGGIEFVLTLAVILVRGGRAVEPGTIWFEALLALLALGFFAGFWVHGGQTLGMRAWRLRLVARDGGPVGWRSAVVRFFAALASAAPAGLGYWWALVDAERLCWHDRLSGTRIVRAAPRAASDEPPR